MTLFLIGEYFSSIIAIIHIHDFLSLVITNYTSARVDFKDIWSVSVVMSGQSWLGGTKI